MSQGVLNLSAERLEDMTKEADTLISNVHDFGEIVKHVEQMREFTEREKLIFMSIIGTTTTKSIMKSQFLGVLKDVSKHISENL